MNMINSAWKNKVKREMKNRNEIFATYVIVKDYIFPYYVKSIYKSMRKMTKPPIKTCKR